MNAGFDSVQIVAVPVVRYENEKNIQKKLSLQKRIKFCSIRTIHDISEDMLDLLGSVMSVVLLKKIESIEDVKDDFMRTKRFLIEMHLNK